MSDSSISDPKQVRLVAAREFRAGSTSTAYRWTTAILAVAVACAILIPALIADSESTATVGVVGPQSNQLERSIDLAGQFSGVDKVKIVKLDSLAEAHSALDSGTVDAVLLERKKVLVDRQPTQGVEASDSAIADSLARVIGLEVALGDLNPDQRARFRTGTALEIEGVKPPQRAIESRLAGAAAAFIIYMFVFIYCQRIAEGVAGEKSSRVIEVLLSTVKPLPLLLGKVIGIGLLSLVQLLAMAGAFIAASVAVSGELLAGDVGQVVLVGSVWLVLSYSLYSGMFAAAGAMVTRQAEATSLTTVLMIPMIATFSISFAAVFGEPSTLFIALGWFPLTAPIAMPVLYAVGEVGTGPMLASALITLITTIVVFRFAALIYQRSVLRMGSRVKLREIFSTED